MDKFVSWRLAADREEEMKILVGPESREQYRDGARLPGSLSQALLRISARQAEIVWQGRAVSVARYEDGGELEDGDVLDVVLSGSGSTVRISVEDRVDEAAIPDVPIWDGEPPSLAAWRASVRAWADQVPAILRGQARQIAADAERAADERLAIRLDSDYRAAVDALNPVRLQSADAAIVSYSPRVGLRDKLQDLLSGERGWTLYLAGLPASCFPSSGPQGVPAAAQFGALSDEDVHRWGHRTGFGAEIDRRWPAPPTGTFRVWRYGAYWLGRSATDARPCIVYPPDLADWAGDWPCSPSERGWWTGDSLVGPKTWADWQTVARRSGGAVWIDPKILELLGTHPDQGWPRFRGVASHGGSRNPGQTWILPIERDPRLPPGQLGELADHLRAAHRLGRLHPAANRVDVEIRNGRLAFARRDVPRAALVLVAMGGLSRTVNLDSALPGDKKDPRAIHSTTASTNGGGMCSSFSILWIPEGETVPLADGSGITWNGAEARRIPGARL